MGILTDSIHFIRLIVFAVLDVLGAVNRPALAGASGRSGFVMFGFHARTPSSRRPGPKRDRVRPASHARIALSEAGTAAPMAVAIATNHRGCGTRDLVRHLMPSSVAIHSKTRRCIRGANRCRAMCPVAFSCTLMLGPSAIANRAPAICDVTRSIYTSPTTRVLNHTASTMYAVAVNFISTNTAASVGLRGAAQGI